MSRAKVINRAGDRAHAVRMRLSRSSSTGTAAAASWRPAWRQVPPGAGVAAGPARQTPLGQLAQTDAHARLEASGQTAELRQGSTRMLGERLQHDAVGGG